MGSAPAKAGRRASAERGGDGGKTKAKAAAPSATPAPPSKEERAAIKLQAWFRGVTGRRLAARQRARMAQWRQEEEHEKARQASRQAAERARQEGAEQAKRDVEAKKEAQLRSFRDRRCAIEQMVQSLTSHHRPWEEEATSLLELLEPRGPSGFTRWLGPQSDRRSARKQYLLLARKWHPDKWAMQGEHCVGAATEVTKCLVQAYEEAMRDLPKESGMVSCEDNDEEREVWEFASWVGVSFAGMHEVWKERKGVTAGKR